MTTSGSEITLDDLLRHHGWLHRIAHHLVRQDADDATQDVWVQAAARPPASAENPRGWLGTVLLNRVRSRSRGDVRRTRREIEAAALLEPPTNPEEATARLELQRKLAAAMTALPEPYKHVIYLRYVEGREPAKIASITDTPPGTVRWRLREGLAKLRARLDDEHDGKRAAWMAVLAPLAAPGETAARPRWPALAAVATVVAFVGLAVSLRRGDAGKPSATRDDSGPVAARAARATAPTFAVAHATAEPETCPAVAPMQASLDSLKMAVDEWRDLRELYTESPPNPKLEQAARPIIEAAFSKAGPGCEHSVSCRGMVCDVVFLTPDAAERTSCWPKTERTFYDHLSRGRNNTVDSGTPFHDPVSGKSYLHQTQLWRFYREDAQAVPKEARPPLPDLRLPGPPPAAPPELSADCGRRWRHLARQYERIAATVSEQQPEKVFDMGVPNPELAARVSQWTARILGRAANNLPFAVACRGQVCALAPGAADDALAIQWQCREAAGSGPAPCFPRREATTWYSLLEAQADGVGRLRFPMKSSSGDVRPAYLHVKTADDRPGPWQAALAFTDSFDWRAALTGCAARFPETGTLKTMTRLPEVSGNEPTALHPSFHAGGDLAGTAVGRCVIAAFQTAAAQFNIPPISNSLVLYGDFKVPFDPSSFETKLARMRKRVEEGNRPIPDVLRRVSVVRESRAHGKTRRNA